MRDPSTSLSSFTHPWAFDVFLSFRGEDTRDKFVGYLYHALDEKGIHVFIDDRELEKGEEISDSLFKAIDKSRILIIIFSKNYASSAWCLDELVKISECMETKGQRVWPIFYDVDPSEVRYQTGSFGIAMAKHENNNRRKPEEIQKWRLALNKVANLSGWHFKSGYEFVFIDGIRKQVTKILNHVPLHVADHPVGLESRKSDLKSLLNIDSGGIRMIGISGYTGIGKTTIARAMYNSIADEFDGASFVADVGENSMRQGLARLQKELLAEITGDNDIKLGNVNKGIRIIQSRLCCMKVLLILDGVTELEQLKMLAGDQGWFGPGSRIIITTKDQDLLIAHGIELRYEMEELSHDEALELLCWHAFKNGTPKMNFEELAKQVARHAKGLPLALELIGCNLYDKEPNEWTWTLDKYEKIPDGNIQRKLRISYDDLDRNEKQIFLDLACFFKGEKLNYVENVLNACGLYAKHGIRRLLRKSLIKIEDNIIKMHDLIQKMGGEIVRESSSDPGKWSRLWFHEDILDVLTTNTGTKKIEGIMLDLPQRAEVQWSGNAFEKMPNLRILIIRNALFAKGPTHLPNTLRLLDWTEYPSTSLPKDFHPRQLVALNLPNSRLRLDTPLPELKQLTRINFTGCKQLIEIPDMSTVPNLTVLQLDNCGNLVKIHDSVGFLGKLTKFSARNCTMLERLPSEIMLPSLERLCLTHCSRLQRLPDVLDKMENLEFFFISKTAVQEFPSSIGNLIGLKYLRASGCTSLSNLPCSMGMLTNLEHINMQNCPQLCQNCKSHCDAGKVTSSSAKMELDLSQSYLSDKDLPVIVGYFPGIKELILSGNNFISISECLKELSHLKILCLDDCEQLQEIRGVPPNLATISAQNCKALSTQSALDVFLDVKVEIVMPGNMVRKWFPYYYEGGSMSFWVRKKFPMPDISVSFEIPEYYCVQQLDCHFYVFLNDFKLFKRTRVFMNVKGNHSWVLHLKSFEILDYELWDEILQEGWSHLKISWEVLTKEVTVCCCGVDVNWEEVSVHDILFKKPDIENACDCAECSQTDEEWKRTTRDHVAGNKDELEVGHTPTILQEILSESSLVQHQLINQQIINESSDRVAKENWNGIMVSEGQAAVDSGMELLLLHLQNDPLTLECIKNSFLSKTENKSKLDLHQSHLSDKDLPVIVSSFPEIEELVLSENNFVNISACLKELSHLKILRLDDCQLLQEIQGVPPNLATVSARNCKSLSSLSAYEVFTDMKVEIIMPGNIVSKWFYHQYEGGSMSFWVREKFPMLDLSVSFRMAEYLCSNSFTCEFSVLLNNLLLFKDTKPFMQVEGNHSWVLHLQSYICQAYSSHEWQRLEHQDECLNKVDELLQEDWNHVKISWEVVTTEDITADLCGVDVYGEEIFMHNILFTKPRTENACSCAECGGANNYFQEAVEDNVSTFSSAADDDICKDELLTDPKIQQKRPHPSIVQQQQCVMEINHHMNEDSERVAKDKGKGVMVHKNQEVDSGRELLLFYPQNGPITLDCVNKNSLPKNQISGNCIPDKKFSASYKVVGRPNKDFGDHLTYSEKELHIRRLPNLRSEFQQKSTLEKNCINQKAPFAMAAASTERAQVSWETSFSEQMNPLTAVEQGGSEHGMVPVSNEPNINDIVAFYASLNEEMGDPSSPHSTRVSTDLANNRRLQEETKKALNILGDFLSNEFSLSMQPEQCSFMVATLNYLLTLSSDYEISPAMKSIIQQLSIEFTGWCSEYCDANEKIKSSTIELSKLDKLKEDLKSNVNRFKEVISLENDLKKRKTYLEEQINAIKEEIDRAAKEKVEIFHDGRNLKVHMDEIKNQSPQLKDVQESAKKTQANIEAEWLKLREQFNKNSHFDP